jgi:hypothetical protein
MSISLKTHTICTKITASWWLLLFATSKGSNVTIPQIEVAPGPDWLTLTWERLSTNESQSFNVSYVPTDGSESSMETDQILSNETHFHVTLTSLSTNTEYRITASWLPVSGNVSTLIMTAYTTPGFVKSITVTNITQLDEFSRPLAKSTIMLSWFPLQGITDYEVSIMELESGLLVYHVFINDWNPPWLIEQVLNHYTRYCLAIRAHSTAGGRGPPSNNILLTDEGLPSMPRNITPIDNTHNTITISWLPPLEVNGILVDYGLSLDRVKYNKESNLFDIVEHVYQDIRVAGNNYTFTSLAAATIYYCHVHAWNNKYPGFNGNIYASTYYGPVTANVTNVKVLTTSSVEIVWSLEVSWDTGVWHNSLLSHYNITVRDDHSNWSLYIIYYPSSNDDSINPPSGHNLIINELPFGPFHLYYVTVKPISNLTSTSSSPFQFRTAEDLPGPPVLSIPKFSPLSPTSTMLSWTSPTNPNGIITQYQIEITTVSYDLDLCGNVLVKQNTSKMNASDTSTEIQLDQPFTTKYLFKVQAATLVGQGNFSNEETLTYIGQSFPRMMSVILNVTSATIRVLWLNPLYNSLTVDKYYLSIFASKEYSVYSRVKKRLNDSRLVTIPVSKAQIIPTQNKDVTLYQAFVSNVIGSMDYSIKVLTENVLDTSIIPPQYSSREISTPPMKPQFVLKPDVLDEGFKSGTAKVGEVTTSERMIQVSSVPGVNGDVVKYAIIVLQLPAGADNSVTLFEAEPVSPGSYEYKLASIKLPYFAFLDEWNKLQMSVIGEASLTNEQVILKQTVDMPLKMCWLV